MIVHRLERIGMVLPEDTTATFQAVFVQNQRKVILSGLFERSRKIPKDL